MNDVIKRMSVITGFDESDIISDFRYSEYVEIRRVCAWILRKEMTSSRAGRILNRTHATVLYSEQKVNDLISINDSLTLDLILKFYTF